MADAGMVEPGAEGYPAALRELARPPAALYIRGSVRRQDILAVAVVGARNPTPYGLSMARLVAGGLAARGVTVVSGMARGIDTAAHQAALGANGRTIAVLGCGLDVDYPRGSMPLKERITGSGALITEFASGTPPLPGNFPRRNRVISGLSLAVVVVEAAHRSGSLITARWAADQGREVMAVPGRADSPLSQGPISLLRDGATPVTGPDDILAALDLDLPGPASGTDPLPDLVRRLSGTSMTAGELAEACGRPAREIMAELTTLEIEGSVCRDPGGRFRARLSILSEST